MDFQTIFVLIIFFVAVGYLVKKFLWAPLTEPRKKLKPTIDGGRTKCGDDNCGCG